MHRFPFTTTTKRTRMAKPKKRRITGGVDTHKDTPTMPRSWLMNGRRLADAEFPTTTAGHAKLLEWMRSFGRVPAEPGQPAPDTA
jgi:hypothetical protein